MEEEREERRENDKTSTTLLKRLQQNDFTHIALKYLVDTTVDSYSTIYTQIIMPRGWNTKILNYPSISSLNLGFN